MAKISTDTPSLGDDSSLGGMLGEFIARLGERVGGGAAAPCGLADTELLGGLSQVEALGRLVDGLRVSFAAEVDDRCAPGREGGGLATRHNFTSAVEFIAAITAVSKTTARRRVMLGRDVRRSVSVTGAPVPATFDHVRQGLHDGVLGIDTAQAIIRPLKAVTRTAGIGCTDELVRAEEVLVGQAQRPVGAFGMTADEVSGLAIRVAAHIDPDGAEPRYKDLCEQRGMVFAKLRSGNTRVTAVLTPEQAGVWKSIDHALLSPRTTCSFSTTDDADEAARGEHAEGSGCARDSDGATARVGVSGVTGAGSADDGPAALRPWESVAVEDQNVDERSAAQRRVDVFTEIIQRASGLPGMPTINGAAPTINLHATLADVISGRGVGWIDGIDEPLPSSVIEQLLCHSDVITTLKDDHGQILRHNKTRRFFTPAQNRALAARDGGCVWPGCDRPPSWCQSHHVFEWKHRDHRPGKTDIENGALVLHLPPHPSAHLGMGTRHDQRGAAHHPTRMGRPRTATTTLPTTERPTRHHTRLAPVRLHPARTRAPHHPNRRTRRPHLRIAAND